MYLRFGLRKNIIICLCFHRIYKIRVFKVNFPKSTNFICTHPCGVVNPDKYTVFLIRQTFNPLLVMVGTKVGQPLMLIFACFDTIYFSPLYAMYGINRLIIVRLKDTTQMKIFSRDCFFG